jgi:hypothetical protein
MLGIGTGGLALSSSAAGLFKITDQPQTSTINADTIDNFDIQKNGNDTNGVINFNTNQKTITIDGTLIVSGSKIPDSINNHYRADAGSGSTLSNVVGTVDASLNGGFSWVSDNKYSEDTAVDYDATNQGYWITDSAIACNQAQATIMYWTDGISAVNDFSRVIATNSDPSASHSNGVSIEFSSAGSTNEVNVIHATDVDRDVAISNQTIPDASTQDLFWAIVMDGDTSNLKVYNTNGLQTDATGTAPRTTGDLPLLGMAGDGRFSAGVMDNALTATTNLTQSEVEQVRDATAGGRL